MNKTRETMLVKSTAGNKSLCMRAICFVLAISLLPYGSVYSAPMAVQPTEQERMWEDDIFAEEISLNMPAVNSLVFAVEMSRDENGFSDAGYLPIPMQWDLLGEVESAYPHQNLPLPAIPMPEPSAVLLAMCAGQILMVQKSAKISAAVAKTISPANAKDTCRIWHQPKSKKLHLLDYRLPMMPTGPPVGRFAP